MQKQNKGAGTLGGPIKLWSSLVLLGGEKPATVPWASSSFGAWPNLDIHSVYVPSHYKLWVCEKQSVVPRLHIGYIDYNLKFWALSSWLWYHELYIWLLYLVLVSKPYKSSDSPKLFSLYANELIDGWPPLGSFRMVSGHYIDQGIMSILRFSILPCSQAPGQGESRRLSWLVLIISLI